MAALVTGSRLTKRRLQSVLGAARTPAGLEADPRKNPALRSAVREARAALVPEGYIQRVLQLAGQGVRELDFPEYDTDWDSEAYYTVSGQNSNNSVRVPNAFYDVLARRGQWELKRRTDGKSAGLRPRRAALGRDRARGVGLRRSRRAVRHHHQRVAHLPRGRAHQREQPVRDRRHPGRHRGRLAADRRAGGRDRAGDRRRRAAAPGDPHLPHRHEAGVRPADAPRLPGADHRRPSGPHGRPRRRGGAGPHRGQSPPAPRGRLRPPEPLDRAGARHRGGRRGGLPLALGDRRARRRTRSCSPPTRARRRCWPPSRARSTRGGPRCRRWARSDDRTSAGVITRTAATAAARPERDRRRRSLPRVRDPRRGRREHPLHPRGLRAEPARAGRGAPRPLHRGRGRGQLRRAVALHLARLDLARAAAPDPAPAPGLRDQGAGSTRTRGWPRPQPGAARTRRTRCGSAGPPACSSSRRSASTRRAPRRRPSPGSTARSRRRRGPDRRGRIHRAGRRGRRSST